MKNIRNIDFSPEWQFRTSRSSGKGGQNVNKVETRVELEFSPDESKLLDNQQKERIKQKLANRINNDGILQLSAESERSQLKNKEKVIEKFYDLMEFALREKKPRKATRPNRKAVEKRLQQKKRLSEKKASRRGDF